MKAKKSDDVKSMCANAAVKGATGVCVLAAMPVMFTIGVLGFTGLACVRAGKAVTNMVKKNNK